MSEITQTRELVTVRYLDHVLYHRASALVMKPQVREAVGWLLYECDQYVTLVWDYDAQPPTLHGGDLKSSGLVLLRTDILELKKLEINSQPLQKTSNCHLYSNQPIEEGEYAFRPTERKTHRRKQRT